MQHACEHQSGQNIGGGVMALHNMEKIEKLIGEKETIAVISAVGKNGNPISQVGRKLAIWEKGRIAYYEFLESSQMQKNLVYSIWFDREVVINLIGKNGENYRVTGKPYQALIAGHQFEEAYINVQKEFGTDTDLSTVWLFDVTAVEDDTYEVAKAREEKEHPYLMHMDHIYRKEAVYD